MSTVPYRFVFVGVGKDAGGDRMICPEPDCGRNFIPSAPVGDEFKVGGKTLKHTGPALDLMGISADFATEDEAMNWQQSKDGRRFHDAFRTVLLVRARR